MKYQGRSHRGQGGDCPPKKSDIKKVLFSERCFLFKYLKGKIYPRENSKINEIAKINPRKFNFFELAKINLRENVYP